MIALVNPPFKSVSIYKYSYSRAKYPHPGLAYLAGYLEKKKIDFEIIDAKFFDLGDDEILGRLRELNPSIIGLTSTTTEIGNAQALATKIKKCLPSSFVMLGGVHATALPFETLESNSSLDAVVAGEGEFVLEGLSGVENVSEVIGKLPGVYYRAEGKIEHTEDQSYSEDLKDYAIAAFHLWPKAEKYYIHTYRGCPFPCSFCFRSLGRRVRRRQQEHVLAELEYIAKHAPGSQLGIYDGTFGLDRKATMDFLKEVISRGLNKDLKWECTTRVDVIDRELLELMKEAGCVNIGFGLESGSDRILKMTGKNISVEKSRQAIQLTRSIGIKTVGYFIFGHMNETRKEIKQTLRLIWKLNTDNIAVGVMTPWPGTKVYELAMKNQGGYRLLNSDYTQYDKYFGSALEFENFDLAYLDFMRIKAFVGLYLYNFRYLELLKFLWKNRKQATNKVIQLFRRHVLGRLFRRTGKS